MTHTDLTKELNKIQHYSADEQVKQLFTAQINKLSDMFKQLMGQIDTRDTGERLEDIIKELKEHDLGEPGLCYLKE